ncbi:MAG: hypothetical protein GY861_04215 [bacterium]|nr:hypothetical protein [bacterium]
MTTLERELLWEREMIDSGVLRYYRSIDRTQKKLDKDGNTVPISDESNTSYGISMLRYFVLSVSKQIEADVKRMKGKPGRKPVAWEYLSELKTETTAYITCKCILDSISKTVKLTQLVTRISQKVEDNARFESFERDDKKYLQSTLKYIKNEKINNYKRKRKIMVNSARKKADGVMEWDVWPMKDKVHIGTACVEAFIKATSDYDDYGKRIKGSGIIELSTQYVNNQTIHHVYGTTKAYEWIKANTGVCQYLTPDFMPTLIPPKDWTTPTDGGFHLKSLRRIKPIVKMQRPKYLKMMHDNKHKMPNFFKTVNLLQATPWEVNSFVLEQAVKEFKLPFGIDMPGSEPLAEPPCPLPPFEQGNMTNAAFKQFKLDSRKALTEEDKEEYVAWKRIAREIGKLEVERVSKAMAVSRTINMAKRLQFEDELYFVWTADFRGRLYAAGTALSPQGTGLSKALIKFKRGCKLGKNGFTHLCIHAAGVYGNDKVSLPDRVQWIMSEISNIIGTGTNPDEYRDFWRQADKPYMFLAVCEELAECILSSTKEREEFISYIPCAQDGSCNGIQHYSAMLRDPVGATSVNLMDSDLPSDIYLDCANKVLEYIDYGLKYEQVFNGKEWFPANELDLQVMRGWLEFTIRRDATKKPTMVIPYGGTKISCRDDCRLYLEKFTKKAQETDKTYKNPFQKLTFIKDTGKPGNAQVYATTLLHHLVWKALDEIVVAARTAMQFLKKITQVIVNDGKHGNMLYWDSPRGFRVYQDIKDTKQNRISTFLEGRIQLTLKEDTKKIDKRRMQTSISPNFVHNLDTTHLQETVCTANDYGITDFCTVHDSFATHAGNTDLLHLAIREEFVNMHAGNVLIDFWVMQCTRFPHLIDKFPPVSDVQQRGFDLDQVLTATHFFR